MNVATNLHFLKASAALRAMVVTELSGDGNAAKALMAPDTAANSRLGGKAGKVATGEHGSWLECALQCVCAASSGPKLVAMMLKAFGLRPAGTIHVPGGRTAHCSMP